MPSTSKLSKRGSITLTREKLGKCRRCGFVVGASASGQTTPVANDGASTWGEGADNSVEVEGCGES